MLKRVFWGKITYDREADAAYIYFSNFVTVDKTYSCDPKEVDGMINLDFSNGKLVGVEVLDASYKLSKEMLAGAEIIG
jgi:uncharacterized protein YuzE